MTRFPDWQIRFQAFVLDKQSEPFSWGRNDCCIFAADCVAALTGCDFASEYRGIYRTEKTAYKLLKEFGGIQGLAENALGASMSRHRATVGDVVLVMMNGREALGICNGATIIGPGANGIAVMDMAGSIMAWKV